VLQIHKLSPHHHYSNDVANRGRGYSHHATNIRIRVTIYITVVVEPDYAMAAKLRELIVNNIGTNRTNVSN